MKKSVVRTIHLPAVDKRLPLGAYVRCISIAKRHPERLFKTGLTTWWPTTGHEIMAQFRQGLHDRINEAIPYSLRGLP